MAFQTALDLGISTHYQLVHKAKGWVSIAISDKQWHQKSHAPHEAVIALEAAADSGHDAYLSQNSLRPYANRTVANTVWLNCLYVDLDTYHMPHVHAMTPLAIIRSIRAEYPELPEPTLYADSGRGVYLIWIFDKPVFCGKGNNDRLIQWQRSEHGLLSLLRNYAADSKASDAARVLRIPGSINTKVGRVVRYIQINDPASFWQLSEAIKAAYCRVNGTAPKPQKTPQIAAQAAPRTAPSTAIVRPAKFNGYSLNYWRMQDYWRLAELRSPMADHRHRLLFCFTVAVVWYCRDPEAVLNELVDLTQHFTPAARYAPDKLLARVRSVIQRLEQANAGGKVLWEGQELDPRFRLTNTRIISDLEITEAEQRELKTIIGKTERNRRRNEKRYNQRRHEYLAKQHQQTEQQRQLCLALRDSGLSQRSIAEQVGLSQSRVNKILK